jgi:hypothetical protein
LALLCSALVDLAGFLSRQGWTADFWPSWIGTALRPNSTLLEGIVPGLVLNAAAAAVGAGLAYWLLESGGRVRVLGRGRLVVNLNSRVFSWFLQQPAAGLFYRVRTVAGSVYVGQVHAFSPDPNDDVQDIVLRDYSVLGKDLKLQPVTDAKEILLERAQITSIERLVYRIPDRQPKTST